MQWTWGILLNIVGVIAALAMLITGHAPHHFGPYIYFRTKWNFGGLGLGMFFIIGQDCDSCACHEMGHGIQNMKYGPGAAVLTLGSVVRYWYRMIKYNMQNKIPPTDYESWWFEGQATKLGTETWDEMWSEHCKLYR